MGDTLDAGGECTRVTAGRSGFYLGGSRLAEYLEWVSGKQGQSHALPLTQGQPTLDGFRPIQFRQY